MQPLLSPHTTLLWYQAMGVTDPVGMQAINRLAPTVIAVTNDKSAIILDKPTTPPTSLFPAIPADIANLSAFNAWLNGPDHTHSLAKMAQQAVLGHGAANPQIVLVAETPDRYEDQSGHAWQNPALQWLQKAWTYAAPHMAAHTYYMYLCPWRPPGQRPLTPDELAYCQTLLRQQLQWLNPQFVVCVGQNVAKTLTTTPIKNNEKQWLDGDLLDNIPKTKLAPLPNSQNMLVSALSKKAVWQQLLALAATL